MTHLGPTTYRVGNHESQKALSDIIRPVITLLELLAQDFFMYFWYLFREVFLY